MCNLSIMGIVMKVTGIKTHKITIKDTNLFSILDKYVPKLKEGSVLAVTSKIVSICEGNVIKIGDVDKQELVERESEYYLDPKENMYGFALTIKNSTLIPTAGIDESNTNGYYVLWPKDSQKTVNDVREYLKKRFSLKNVGVVITDSTTRPLRWGVGGIALAHSGFLALNDYIGTKDIFGKEMRVTKVGVMDGLAAASVLQMGEGKEQTPLAVIEDIPFVKFQDRNPTKKELNDLVISMKEDLYAPILTKAKWKKGRK